MRVNLTSIVCYIFIELDFYLKLQKDAENCLYISVTNKKRYYQSQRYNGHFILDSPERGLLDKPA